MIVPVLFSIWDMAFVLIVGLLGASSCIGLALWSSRVVGNYLRVRRSNKESMKHLITRISALENERYEREGK